MKTNEILHITETLQRQMQENYAEALRNDDHRGMQDHAGQLYRSYAQADNGILARKWTEEYIRCWIGEGSNPPDDRSDPEPMMDPALLLTAVAV